MIFWFKYLFFFCCKTTGTQEKEGVGGKRRRNKDFKLCKEKGRYHDYEENARKRKIQRKIKN